MNKAVVLLGSNTGNTLGNLERAILLIREKTGTVSRISNIYETEPWGISGQPLYYNQAIELDTMLDPQSLITSLLEIENVMGRKRVEKWAPRLIDLDIIYYNDMIINEPGLNIPHPHLHERRFTLVPLTEILPDFIHPVFKKRNRELLEILTDPLEVRPLIVNNVKSVI